MIAAHANAEDWDHLNKWSNGTSAARAGTEAAENDALAITRLKEAQCIASDDPRPKETQTR